MVVLLSYIVQAAAAGPAGDPLPFTLHLPPAAPASRFKRSESDFCGHARHLNPLRGAIKVCQRNKRSYFVAFASED